MKGGVEMLAALGRSSGRMWLLPLTALLAVCLVSACTTTPHKKALNYYDSGDPFMAEQTITPLLEKSRHKNHLLYLWDAAMFRFAQGNFIGANELWRKAGEIAGIEPGAMQSSLELFNSDVSRDFIGDPVEHSMSWLFVGLGYYMSGDYENATVALRKSLEWDYSVEVERQGDMVITNTLLGECYTRTGDHDQAVVAYRRALATNAGFLPAYVGLCRELRSMGDQAQVGKFCDELAAKAPDGYIQDLEGKKGGILVVVMSGAAPTIERDKFLGAFRKRAEVKSQINHWIVECVDESSRLTASLADDMITHFKDQGGERGQALRKGVQMAAQVALQNVPIVGLFAPSTQADVRYWSTVPGRVYAAYLPLTPGVHTIRASAFDERNRPIDHYQQVWHYIPVGERRNTILVLIGHANLEKLM